jgi:excisionase family DNA binding protein
MAQKIAVKEVGPPVQVYTVHEVATILKVSPRSIERLVATNQLAAIRVGRRLRVTVDQLHAYMHPASTSADTELPLTPL